MRVRCSRSILGVLGNGLVVCALLDSSGRSFAGAQLPVACTPVTCGANVSFLGSGRATLPSVSGNTLSVIQSTNTATLNWSSFNIGAGGRVVFEQPSSTSIALNRIFDSNPSSIFGTLTANGQIYLINPNGFLFGSTATVNVGGLLASSLNLSSSTFASGILQPGTQGLPALQAFTDASGNPISQNITVQAGANLTAADNGRLLLAAPNVYNSGSLSAPDGQIILAAGQSLYLQASENSDLRGLIVQVDGGGTVANQLQGSLSAPRGNITLTGLMVNQDGRISATTSVAANGSVILEAADDVNKTGYTHGSPFEPTQGGTVELGPGSVTEVLPEYSDTRTAVAAQTQLQSSISITGQQVFVHDATIDAPSGVLNVVAEANPSQGIQSESDPDAEIRIDAGTTIDLAGSDAELPMSANLLTVQLRSNEFANDPTQRGGALQSTPANTVSVTVDIRADGGQGTPIADLESAIAGIGQSVAQRTETGGTATFESEGDVVFNPGASINVSGGHTTYEAGSIQTTKLIGANGELYDIGSANPLLRYTGVVNPTFTQTYSEWGIQQVIPTPGLSQYESSYVQGASAGAVQFAAPSMVLAGSLQGTAISGPYQRSTPPAGGTLIIGLPVATVTTTDYLAPSVSLATNPIPIVVADGTPLPEQTLQLPTAYLTSDGFTGTTIYSNTIITLPARLPLTLPSGGSMSSVAASTPTLVQGASLALVAPQIDVDSSIAATDGHLWFESVLSSATPEADTPRAGVGIGNGVTLDVSGQWTNDAIFSDGIGTAPISLNGGSISAQLTVPGSELVLGDAVTLRANGGAWVESGGTLSYGTGGAIKLDASPAYSAIQFGASDLVQAFGTGTASGGSFTLLAPRIDISQGEGSSWTEAQRADDLNSTSGGVLQLYAPLFSDYGFSSVSLTATGAVESTSTDDVLTVKSGTELNVQASTAILNPNYLSMPTGSALATFSQTELLPLYERPNASISLNVIREPDDQLLGSTHFGLLDIQAGASIVTDPGATISLEGEGGMTIAGLLRAPGGTIGAFIPSAGDIDSNSAQVIDPGYVPTLSLYVAPSAVLDVDGTTVLTPNSQGLLSGTILPGGSVNLKADRGTVVTAPGSTIDMTGTAALLDVPNPADIGGDTLEVVASAGGSLTVSSGESISLLGKLNAAAGVGTSGAAAAGSLEVDLIRSGVVLNPQSPPLPSGTLEIELVDSTAGGAPSSSDSSIAVLGAEQIADSGIDSLTLRTSGDILIDAGQLTLGRQMILDAPSFIVPASASLAAPFVEIGNSVVNDGSNLVAIPTPTSGSGTLSVSAQQIVLLGNFSLQGISSATLSSAGDVQLQGTSTSNTTGPTTGSLLTDGNLILNAERVYPDTYTDFDVTSLAGNGATVTIGRTGASPGLPLSADGSLSVSADNILIKGTVLAPFGTIDLTANDGLTLAHGSLLSVSGAGLNVPFGETELNQGEWVYITPGGGQNNINTITGVPAKSISLSAPNVDVQAGSTANVEGGGDLYAYEWVPGTGGTYDNLGATCCATSSVVNVSSISNLYAILPSTRGQAGPYDPEESGNAVAGQTIYLSGGAGIAAGYYALLPPRYALEPGAVLIQLESAYTSASGGQIDALADGVPVIAGFLSIGTTGLHTGNGLTEYVGVAIYPSGYAQRLASYTISDASTFFQAVASSAGTGPVPEPADGGTFNLTITAAAINSLELQGNVLTASASGGRGAEISIDAPDLTITAGNATSPGALDVSSTVLQSWNASSITLGGTGTTSTQTASNGSVTTTTTIAVGANTVTVDPGVQLTADQIEIVAQQSIDVQAGASLMSTSGKSGTPLSSLPSPEAVLLTDTTAAANPSPQAALLAVSDLSLPVVTRSAGVGLPGANITVAQGATLASGGALAFDAPGEVTLAGTLKGKGASWSLSSGSVAFVGSGTSADTLNIDSSLVSALQQAGAVRIASQGDIDLDTPVSLGVNRAGTPTLNSLALIANSIDNQGGSGSTFGATRIVLGGNVIPTNASSAPPAAGAGSGALSFVGNTLTIGPGVLSVNGFGETTAKVQGAFETGCAAGVCAGYLNVGGGLTIDAAELTPADDAADEPGTTIAATGTLTIGAPSAAITASSLPKLVGGSLTLQASDIEDAGAIVAPSGVVALDSTGNLHLLSTASIDASGTALQVAGTTVYTPGGIVTLTAGGNITLDPGSSVAVAGRASAPAGSLSLEGGNGTVTLSSVLDGAGSGNAGGSLAVDAGSLTGGLMGLLDNPGFAGFNQAVNLRVRKGDLDLASTGIITANGITLTADSGTVDIAGTLNAPSAAQRGLIDLSGGDSVVLESTGQLHADGNGSTGRGGEIDINSVMSACTSTGCTSTGSIILDSGSVISTYGAAQMGEFVLRAPALLATNDVAINPGEHGIGANVAEAGEVIVEPVIVSPTSSATVSSDLPNAVSATTSFLGTSATGIAARLSSSSSAPLVEAGVELQDPDPTDTLSVGSYDFSQNSTQGQVIDVTVRAAGSITLDGTISDGFYAGTLGSGTTLTGLPSGSLSFVAGADLSSANPLSVLTGSAAALTLAPQTIVRTGTGDIDLAAAGDIVFDSGAAVYTGGLNGAAAIQVGVGRNSQLANFPTQGGNVVISAGGSVIGAPLASNLDNGDLAVTGWQPREITTVNGTQIVGAYGVDFDAFDWNVGALGGGDLSVTAVGTVSNLSATTADSSPDAQTTLLGAGGGLRIDSVGDIGSAQVYVADGAGTVITNAGLTPIIALPLAPGSTTPTYAGSTFALGDAQIAVWARQSVQVEAVYNPTFVPSSTGRASGQFFTYGTDSGLTLSSTDGDVTFDMEPRSPAVAALLGLTLSSNATEALIDLPPNLAIQAAQQDIDLSGAAILFPSSTGELSLFAGQDIVANGARVLMSDSFASNVPTAANPEVTLATGGLSLGGLAELQGAIHVGDSTPALVTAGRDIDDLGLEIPKAAQISAGRDIVNLTYQGQNIAASDTTGITAGRDITYTAASNGIELGGEGSLDIFAGRSINLGVSGGILTTGNLQNANLASAQGADLIMALGYGTQGADYPLFVKDIIAPSSAYRQQLIAYVEGETGESKLSFAEAEADFAGFTQGQQAALVDPIFFNELLLSGRAANSGSGVGFSQGYAAVNALYPYSHNPTAAHPQPYEGSLSLISSQVYTLSGGNISIVVPGGSINVGLAYTPVGVIPKPPAELGIVAEGAGNVDIYTQGDVNVNASRIFTLGGGNILIWSDEGSIDAGNGSKSSLSVPPPVVLVNADGSITLDYGASLAAGSGIRTIQTSPTTPAGDVDLDAPVGTVNAGDAGIGAAGNINIAAAHVIGALNINFGGTASGVPSDLSGLSASLSGVSAVAASATTSSTSSLEESAVAAKETAPIAQTALSWLDVFVTGLGEENCKPDDIECLKRQKTAAP
ncbi:MAG TPA: filamentous hemagglutinin family protein [Steroidobacteraceae bacterium]|nr:filamentous hemagglutinin family protein [Steroidobacteraceae bacterium]